MTDTPFQPVLRTQADLLAAWQELMQPLGFSRTSLWLMLIGDDDRPLPHLTEVAGCDGPAPPPDQQRGFAEMLAQLLAEVSGADRWAVLRTRPGRSAIDALDRAWAAGIHDACRALGVPLEVIHLATDESVVPIPLDELTGYVRAS